MHPDTHIHTHILCSEGIFKNVLYLIFWEEQAFYGFFLLHFSLHFLDVEVTNWLINGQWRWGVGKFCGVPEERTSKVSE